MRKIKKNALHFSKNGVIKDRLQVNNWHCRGGGEYEEIISPFAN